jgi:hypothetical protein
VTTKEHFLNTFLRSNFLDDLRNRLSGVLHMWQPHDGVTVCCFHYIRFHKFHSIWNAYFSSIDPKASMSVVEHYDYPGDLFLKKGV